MIANVHIKTDARLESESRVLREYGIDPSSATRQDREFAETVSARLGELETGMRKDGWK